MQGILRVIEHLTGDVHAAKLHQRNQALNLEEKDLDFPPIPDQAPSVPRRIRGGGFCDEVLYGHRKEEEDDIIRECLHQLELAEKAPQHNGDDDDDDDDDDEQWRPIPNRRGPPAVLGRRVSSK